MGGAGCAGKDPGYPKHRVGSSHLGDGGKIRGQRGLSQVSFESYSIFILSKHKCNLVLQRLAAVKRDYVKLIFKFHFLTFNFPGIF